MKRILTLTLASAFIVACGGGGGQPTQEQLAKQLTELATALEGGDMDKAADHMMVPPGRSIDEMKPMLPKLLEKKEISSAGVKILLEKGKFGKLADVFPDNAGKRAERAGVKLEECYGLRLDPAEVMAHWDGSKFKLFRLDDVGKLTPDPAPAEPAPAPTPTEEPKAEPAPAEPAPAPAEPAPAPAPEGAAPAPAPTPAP